MADSPSLSNARWYNDRKRSDCVGVARVFAWTYGTGTHSRTMAFSLPVVDFHFHVHLAHYAVLRHVFVIAVLQVFEALAKYFLDVGVEHFELVLVHDGFEAFIEVQLGLVVHQVSVVEVVLGDVVLGKIGEDKRAERRLVEGARHQHAEHGDELGVERAQPQLTELDGGVLFGQFPHFQSRRV